MEIIPAIRTCAKSAQRDSRTKSPEKPDAGARLIARVLRDVLHAGRFESTGDLKAAVRTRCHGLGIRCLMGDLDRALDLVGTNHPLVSRPRPAVLERPSEPPPINRAEAAVILARLQIQPRGMR